MRPVRAVMLALLAAAFGAGAARAQTGTGPPPGVATATAAAGQAAPERAWSFSAAASTYVLPDDEDFVSPVFAADRGWLHLEGRYNYEGRRTGSAWFGYNFGVGDRVRFEITPMVGAVFGDTKGVAPGYKGSLGWSILQLYSETEFVFDASDSADNFLYTWSELEVAPVEWCRFGIVVQRTKVYKTDFDIQRGVFAGVSYKGAAITAYVFNPDAGKPSLVLGVALGF